MKIQGENYQYIKNQVREVVNKHPSAEQDYKQAGHSPTRFRWDLFWATNIRIGDGIGINGDINIEGCNDNHIHTAIKRICKELGLEWASQ